MDIYALIGAMAIAPYGFEILIYAMFDFDV